MRLPPKSKYPRKLRIGDAEWSVIFVDQIEGKDTMGMCDPSNNVISIKNKQTANEMFKTFIHEILHSIELEYEIKISHKNVYKLENAIAQVLLDNF